MSLTSNVNIVRRKRRLHSKKERKKKITKSLVHNIQRADIRQRFKWFFFVIVFVLRAAKRKEKHKVFDRAKSVQALQKSCLNTKYLYFLCLSVDSWKMCRVGLDMSKEEKKNPSSKFVSTNRTSQVARKVKWNQKH